MELPVKRGAPSRERFDWNRFAAVAALAVVLLGVVFGVVFTHLWYAVHAGSDIPLYHQYAGWLADGAHAYGDFAIEYPPLALLLFVIPGHTSSLADFVRWFSFEMFAITLATAILVASSACVLWPRGRRPYVAVALFAAGVTATGAIIENRYDVAVALVVIAVLALLLRDLLIPACLVLGLGFALKLTPIVLLPLALLFAHRRRHALAGALAFAFSAGAPFAFYAARAPAGVEHVFRYLADRPLQLESVLGTPLLVGKVLHLNHATAGFAFGSNSILAPGAGAMAVVSGPLTVAALTITYLLIWRRRAAVRSAGGEQLPLAMLAVVLAVMVFGKVLSPQYMIWLLPLQALVAVRDRAVRALGLLVLALTQLEYPSFYGALVKLKPEAVAILALRNLLLVALLTVVLWRLARLPVVPEIEGAAGAGPGPGTKGYNGATAPARRGTDRSPVARP